MTTINCTSNCKYQENGECALQIVQFITSTATQGCAYYTLNEKEEKKVIGD